MATRPLGVEAPGVALALRRPGAWTVLGRFCRKKPLGAIGGFLMLVILLTAVFADQLQTYDPIATDAGQSLARPGADHWLGSDHLGRDIYSRIVHGARVSLIVGLASTLMGSVLGGIIGLLSGYVGGKTDLVKLAKGEHLKLRYGILLHSGDAAAGKVADRYQQFVKLK